YGDEHSFLNMWMAPNNCHIVGTAHSHPDYCNEASEEDLTFFSNMGGYHIITCMPYDRTSWKIYDCNGEEADLEIVSCIF
ncbi:MAG: Mov34/MPN/PAD-1 family protein, partial [Candidatus Methanomethylophilaceae archaeon]|nr:Mov34/MPN/PAD-1 family protein [Candidatus Methanomethylophilaceae archaeon]